MDKKRRNFHLAAGIITIVAGGVSAIAFLTSAFLFLYNDAIHATVGDVHLVFLFVITFFAYFVICSLATAGGVQMLRQKVGKAILVYNTIFNLLISNVASLVLCIIILCMKDEEGEVAVALVADLTPVIVESSAVVPVASEPSAPVNKPASVGEIEQSLKKYKKMLDDGLISQKDFDAKKKQLLNL
jgi:O-antigen/teichoic acid export membrane protein